MKMLHNHLNAFLFRDCFVINLSTTLIAIKAKWIDIITRRKMFLNILNSFCDNAIIIHTFIFVPVYLIGMHALEAFNFLKLLEETAASIFIAFYFR